MMHYGPWLELLGFCWVFVRLLASLTEFIGHDLEVEPLPPPLVAVEPAYPHYSPTSIYILVLLMVPMASMPENRLLKN